MHYEIKRALVGITATTMAAPIVGFAILAITYLYLLHIPIIKIWECTSISAIILTQVTHRHIEDREIQNIIVALPFIMLMIGFVPAIYYKEYCGIEIYPAEKKIVGWFEKNLF